MNERIRELADQALKECDAAKERGIDQYSKRFAELIVRESIDVVARATASPNGYQALMKHFGI
jgi:predicted Fe-Mo cluster-binding NifX family protein